MAPFFEPRSQLNAGSGINKVRRANFDRRSPCEHIFHYVLRGFDTAKPYNRDPNGLGCVMHQPYGYRADCRPGQSTGSTTQPRFSSVCIYTHCGVGICDYQGVRPSFFGCLGHNSNESNGGC